MHAPQAAHEPVTKRHRPSGLTVFLSAFVAGAVVSFGLNHFVDAQLAQNRPQVECEPIFVALRSLPQGTPVTVWDVALKDWPLAMLPTSALRAEDSFEGMVLRYPLREGQPLLAVQLTRAPTDHSAIAAGVETFRQPVPATPRQAPTADSDSWLPAPQTTSTEPARDTQVAGPPLRTSVEPPVEPVAAVPAFEDLAQNTPGTERDPTFVDDATDVPALPLVAIAATPVEPEPDPAIVDQRTVDPNSVGSASTPVAGETPQRPLDEAGIPSAVMPREDAVAGSVENVLDHETPADAGVPEITEPAEAVVATDEPTATTITTVTTVDAVGAADEPGPFVAARRRPPVAPHPQLDIADSIAALSRQRAASQSDRVAQPSPDAPTSSVLVAPTSVPEAVMQEAVMPEAGAQEAGVQKAVTQDLGLTDTTVAVTSPAADPSAAADPVPGLVATGVDRGPTQPSVAPTVPAMMAPEVEEFEAVASPLPIPRYLVIPERIALEADSFFGPIATEVAPSDPLPGGGGQPGQASSARSPYEAPPMANPPPPSFGEMFPNIANGIDALTGPFRGRSASQPRRTR